MTATLKHVENLALQLSSQERRRLIQRLIASLEGESRGSPETIAKAWDEEIARRVAEIDAGTAELIPHEQVMAKIDEILNRLGN